MSGWILESKYSSKIPHDWGFALCAALVACQSRTGFVLNNYDLFINHFITLNSAALSLNLS